MRCSQCGLPLSPSRTHCPRCGAAAGSEKRPSGKDAPSFQPGVFSANGVSVNPEGPGVTETHQPPWGQYSPAPWNGRGGPGGEGGASLSQQPFPTINDPSARFRNQEATVQSEGQQFGSQNPAWYTPETPMSPQNWSSSPTGQPRYAQTPQPFHSTHGAVSRKRTARFGFTIAGLCIAAGGLILLFVYILSQNVPPPGSSSSLGAVGQHQATATGSATQVPTAIPSPTPNVTTPTAYPAQHYIVDAQMASEVNENTGALITPATNFKVKQKTYLVVNLAPHDQAGAICSLWYINNQHIVADDFPIVVSPTTPHTYEYIYPDNAGPAYVEIYWASSDQCTDKLLAKRIDFTVTE